MTDRYKIQLILADVRERKGRMKKGYRAGAKVFAALDVIDIMDEIERNITNKLIDP